jgi:hypothetical protein
MTATLRLLGLAALLGTLVPSLLYLAGSIDLARVQQLMLAATVAWFVVQALLAVRGRQRG